jgi:DNA invertase Pin-like site-specific DNA recombinase
MKEKKDALKGRKVFIYSRVSTPEQEGTLEDQTSAVKRGLKELGFTGKAEVFEEQMSGTKIDRPVLIEMIKQAKESKRPAVIVVRDIQRFSRDPYDIGELYNPLRDAEIPVLSINEPLVLGTRKVPQPGSDLLAPILVAAGGQEVSTRLQQTLQGVEESRKKGIFSGTPLDLYPKDALEPRGEMIRYLKAGVNPTQTSKRLGKSTSWVRKNKVVVEEILLAGGDELLASWLQAVNLVRNMEIEKGEGKGPKATVRMKTVRRMTSGYLATPKDFDAPTQADLNEYFTNFSDYKKR